MVFEHVEFASFGLYALLLKYHRDGNVNIKVLLSIILTFISSLILIFKNYKTKYKNYSIFKSRKIYNLY